MNLGGFWPTQEPPGIGGIFPQYPWSPAPPGVPPGTGPSIPSTATGPGSAPFEDPLAGWTLQGVVNDAVLAFVGVGLVLIGAFLLAGGPQSAKEAVVTGAKAAAV